MSSPCPYQLTRKLENGAFPALTVTFTPTPSPELARSLTRIEADARKNAKTACKKAGLKDMTDEYEARYSEEYAVHVLHGRIKFVLEKLVGWDFVMGGNPVPLDADGLSYLPGPVFNSLLELVAGQIPGEAVDVEDAKKS